MRENVIISLTSKEEGAKAETYTYYGYRQYKNGKHFVLYQEPDAEGVLHDTVIRVEEKMAAVLRHEKVGGHMVFDPSHVQRVKYYTQYGDMDLFMTTTMYRKDEEGDDMFLNIDYALQVLMSEDEAPDPEKKDIVRSIQIVIKKDHQ